MSARFRPTREDGRSFRDVAVDVIKDAAPETVIAYRTLADALGLHPARDKEKLQKAVRAANKILLKLYRRGVRNVPLTGYRVLPAREHMIVADAHQTKADRAMARALNFYEGANLAEMTEIERKLHQQGQMLAQAIISSHRHLDRRLKRVEELLRGSETLDA